jgi:N-acetylglucosamine kinase-like BadF-type ATPase
MESGSPRQPLVKAVLEKTTVNSVMELTKAVYEQPFPRTAIAAIAPIVVQAAESGDDDANAILDEAARELANLVGRAVRSLKSHDGTVKLAAAGGLLVGSQRLQTSLRDELQRSGISLEMQVVEEPLEGCVRLAAPEFAETLIKWQ